MIFLITNVECPLTCQLYMILSFYLYRDISAKYQMNENILVFVALKLQLSRSQRIKSHNINRLSVSWLLPILWNCRRAKLIDILKEVRKINGIFVSGFSIKLKKEKLLIKFSPDSTSSKIYKTKSRISSNLVARDFTLIEFHLAKIK